MALRLTEPLLEAMDSALRAALAGDGFDDGDFAGDNREHFERARSWIAQERAKRAAPRHAGQDH
jgi:hypothetical protein